MARITVLKGTYSFSGQAVVVEPASLPNPRDAETLYTEIAFDGSGCTGDLTYREDLGEAFSNAYGYRGSLTGDDDRTCILYWDDFTTEDGSWKLAVLGPEDDMVTGSYWVEMSYDDDAAEIFTIYEGNVTKVPGGSGEFVPAEGSYALTQQETSNYSLSISSDDAYYSSDPETTFSITWSFEQTGEVVDPAPPIIQFYDDNDHAVTFTFTNEDDSVCVTSISDPNGDLYGTFVVTLWHTSEEPGPDGDLISEQTVTIGSLTEPVECAALTAGDTPLGDWWGNSSEIYVSFELSESGYSGEATAQLTTNDTLDDVYQWSYSDPENDANWTFMIFSDPDAEFVNSLRIAAWDVDNTEWVGSVPITLSANSTAPTPPGPTPPEPGEVVPLTELAGWLHAMATGDPGDMKPSNRREGWYYKAAGGQIDITPLSNEEYFWNELAERLAGGE